MSVSLATVLDAAITGTQVSKVDQRFTQASADAGPGGFAASFASDYVTSADTLDIAAGSISGNSGQKSAQFYTAFDTSGTCYEKMLEAAHNELTRASETTCNPDALRGALREMLAPL